MLFCTKIPKRGDGLLNARGEFHDSYVGRFNLVRGRMRGTSCLDVILSLEFIYFKVILQKVL